MKEILFKAKRTDNGEWVEGYYCRYGFVGKEKHYIIPSYASDLYAFEIDINTLCQYTGLTDKNGNKIWENDIVRYDGDGYCNCIGIVKSGVWSQDASGGEYSGKRCDGYYVELNTIIPYQNSCETADEISEYFPYFYKQYSLASLKDVEKIGNIFDNKELLSHIT